MRLVQMGGNSSAGLDDPSIFPALAADNQQHHNIAPQTPSCIARHEDFLDLSARKSIARHSAPSSVAALPLRPELDSPQLSNPTASVNATRTRPNFLFTRRLNSRSRTRRSLSTSSKPLLDSIRRASITTSHFLNPAHPPGTIPALLSQTYPACLLRLLEQPVSWHGS